MPKEGGTSIFTRSLSLPLLASTLYGGTIRRFLFLFFFFDYEYCSFFFILFSSFPFSLSLSFSHISVFLIGLYMQRFSSYSYSLLVRSEVENLKTLLQCFPDFSSPLKCCCFTLYRSEISVSERARKGVRWCHLVTVSSAANSFTLDFSDGKVKRSQRTGQRGWIMREALPVNMLYARSRRREKEREKTFYREKCSSRILFRHVLCVIFF